MTRFLVLFLTLLCAGMGLATAKPWWNRGAESNDGDFLPPDVAFRVAARVDGNVLHIRYVIADGYYLYKQRMEIQAESPDLIVEPAVYPAGVMKTDPYLGTQEIFLQQVEATAAFTRSDGGAHPIEIKLTYQGCAEAGLCYPPISKVMFPSVGEASMPRSGGGAGVALSTGEASVPRASAHAWEGWAIGAGGLAFLVAGLLLRKGRRLDTLGL